MGLWPFLLSLACMRPDSLIVGGGDDGAGANDTASESDADTDSDTDTDSDSDTDTSAQTGFALLVAECQYGVNPEVGTWGGVLQYALADSASSLKPIEGIDADELDDPYGLAWRESSSEVFVANGHGQDAGDGVSGSISRFVYDSVARTFTPNGIVTSGTLDAPHQIAFDPDTGALFATDFYDGILQFTFDKAGVATPNRSIGDGTTRGVVVSPGGTKLWVTVGVDQFIRQFNLKTGAELPQIDTENGAGLHGLAIHDGMLYAAGLSSDAIYRFSIDADDELTLADAIPATFPIDMTFSPDGLYMYTSSHSQELIERFAYDKDSDTWSYVDGLDTGESLGSIMVLK
jgi:DNA-binding beta-propeller fold protein YncE